MRKKTDKNRKNNVKAKTNVKNSGKNTFSAITKDTNIGEVVQKYPETISIMMGFGLHCIGCHVSYYETIEQGCQSHGMSSEHIDKMIKEMNSVVEKYSKEPLQITDSAVKKLKELAKGQDFGLRIAVSQDENRQFELSLEHKPKKEEKTIKVKAINIFIEEQTLRFVKGSTIDFLNEKERKGFVISRA